MKGLIWLIIIVLIAWGAYAFLGGENEGDVMGDKGEMVHDDEKMDDNEMMDDKDGEDMMGNEVSFDLTGVNFAFSETELRVKEGDTVTINFESTEGFHDWVVDEFDAATKQVAAGEPTSVTFVASKAGTYEYYCSVGQHRQAGMVGNLIVE